MGINFIIISICGFGKKFYCFFFLQKRQIKSCRSWRSTQRRWPSSKWRFTHTCSTFASSVCVCICSILLFTCRKISLSLRLRSIISTFSQVSENRKTFWFSFNDEGKNCRLNNNRISRKMAEPRRRRKNISAGSEDLSDSYDELNITKETQVIWALSILIPISNWKFKFGNSILHHFDSVATMDWIRGKKWDKNLHFDSCNNNYSKLFLFWPYRNCFSHFPRFSVCTIVNYQYWCFMKPVMFKCEVIANFLEPLTFNLKLWRFWIKIYLFC